MTETKLIEKPWVVYEYGGSYYIGRVVEEFSGSFDIAFASFDRVPKGFSRADVPLKTFDIGEAIAFAISRGSKKEDLEKMLKEGFPEVKID